MALQFILGRSGTGKTTSVLNEIREKLHNNPRHTPLVYIVPEQMTFSSEYKLAGTPDLKGMMSAQVFSFTRLAWRVLQETGGMSRKHLSSAGMNMMITKIIEEKKDELKIFQRSAGKTGFISSMEDMLIELKRYCITPEAMGEIMIEQLDDETNQVLKDKLHDLELIYREFERALFGKYINSEHYLTLLAEKISQSSYLQEAEIYIDGFFSLTPQELLVVQELLKTCKKVTVALTLDTPFRQGPPVDFHLFGMSARLYQNIYQLAVQSDIEIEQDIVMTDMHRFNLRADLEHLEKKLNVLPTVPYEGETGVTVMMAANRRVELEGIAREILKLVREQHYKWRDITVLVRNGNDYADLVKTIFQDYRIPFFIDAKETMLHHPLIELIRSSLETLQTNWRYEPVFRAIKTELLYPLKADRVAMRHNVDLLENFVLARGIKGEQWTGKERWTYHRFKGLELEDIKQNDKEIALENQVNEWKELFSKPLITLGKRCKKAKTGIEYCQALYLFLEEVGAPDHLDQLRMKAEEEGRLIEARRHDQVWKSVIDLLDQFVETMRDTKLNLKQFISILDSGLQALQFSQVPPALDQVIVANLDLSRQNDVKIAFVIGLNEGVLPMKATEEGIFTDSDRQLLNKTGIELAPDSTVRLFDEEFTAYKAFTTASEKLYVSYPLGDEEGGSLLASPYIKRIKEILPKACELYLQNEPQDDTKEQQLMYMPNESIALSYLTAVLQQQKRGYKPDDVWYSLYNYLLESNQGSTKMVLSSLHYENKARRLSSQTSKGLYGKKVKVNDIEETKMQASVSRMERYNSCAFSHFASHGLGLKERNVYRLEAPDIGELFHGALKIISDTLLKENIQWSALSQEQCHQLASAAVEQLAPKLQNQILLSSNRHHYIKRKLENVIGRASIALSEQAKHSGFTPFKLELGFGNDNESILPPYPLKLADGTDMELIGRIDRVDTAKFNDQIYVRIIDYKSSSKDVNLDEVYYGLALQMLTYLDVLIQFAPQLIGQAVSSAGMLYFYVHNPIIKANEMMDLSKLEKEIFKQFKMKGLLVDKPEILQLMDDKLIIGESSKSDIISVNFLKNGDISKTSKVASEQDFDMLRNHIHHLYKKAGNEILNGETIINPYKKKDKIPCTYCAYKSVCMFDQALEENEYRILQPKKANEVLQLIKEEGGQA
ncbi:helicase-exonuclease AddAB subunit AddB [Bacillus sp. AGMB 02131]|uniref:ATP-dependent helicase/deoxyribonuclease subunit B n=1 Tax=Peribacillus faecalis TaxID=2772559 RepID=A0A927CYZ0_9BACI|nr:helicase-exonuclease AddAB subunit AddB [Peribacillus faecalis]MBD3110283.1 helicase-exonuclease AddAB subunit AddB [Peribacillus faecalis]